MDRPGDDEPCVRAAQEQALIQDRSAALVDSRDVGGGSLAVQTMLIALEG
jgi:hypothetical protein